MLKTSKLCSDGIIRAELPKSPSLCCSLSNLGVRELGDGGRCQPWTHQKEEGRERWIVPGNPRRRRGVADAVGELGDAGGDDARGDVQPG